MSSFVPRKVLGKFMHVTDIPLKRGGDKCLVFFLGAGFCPFCAAERWAIVGALSRFGKWTNLLEDKSASHDEKYLNVPTLNFARAEYQSDFVEFIGRETADRNFEPLQELTTSDNEILDMYNPDNIIPFLLIDGQFAQVGSGYSPQLLQNMDHTTVKSQIDSANSPVGKAVKGEIDNITALICKSLKNSGSSRCRDQEIMELMKKL